MQHGVMQCLKCTWYTGGAAECMACLKTSMLNDAFETICDKRAGDVQGSRQIWCRSVTSWRICQVSTSFSLPLCRTLARPHATSPPSVLSFSRSDPSDVKDGGTVARRPGAQRMMMYALHLRVDSSPRHTQNVAASPAIQTATTAIIH